MKTFYEDKKIIGIDPGSTSGGIAIFSIDKKEILETAKIKDLTSKDLYDLFCKYKNNSVAFLEKVGGMPGQGGMAMFNFGKNVGHIEMALLANKIPYICELPQMWQKEFHLGIRGKKSKTEWKKILRNHAQQLYPNIKITAETADAILLMEYGLRNKNKYDNILQ